MARSTDEECDGLYTGKNLNHSSVLYGENFARNRNGVVRQTGTMSIPFVLLRMTQNARIRNTDSSTWVLNANRAMYCG